MLRQRKGQSLLEVTILAPVGFLLIFLALQIGHIGIAMGVVRYATASVAREAVQNNSSNVDKGHFKRLMKVGLKEESVDGTIETQQDELTRNMNVVGCAKLTAYPFVGDALRRTRLSNGGDTCSENSPMISIAGDGPYHFVIRSQTTVRLNIRRQT